MNNPRTIMLSAVAGGVLLGLFGGAQVSTAMKPGPEMPFRWAEGWTPPVVATRFADSIPLELDVPGDFQVRTASIEGDPAVPDRAAHEPRRDWASLRLAQYKVDAPEALPEPDRFAADSYGAAEGADAAAGANAGLEAVLADGPVAGDEAAPTTDDTA